MLLIHKLKRVKLAANSSLASKKHFDARQNKNAQIFSEIKPITFSH